jgi:acetyl-CoA synthetase
VVFVDELPKTQSGKIIRRAIASIYRGEDVGDLDSLENPGAIDAIRAAR